MKEKEEGWGGGEGQIEAELRHRRTYKISDARSGTDTDCEKEKVMDGIINICSRVYSKLISSIFWVYR